MDKLLEMLKGAGVDVDSLGEEHLSGLTKSLQGEIEAAKAAAAVEAQKRLDEMDNRRKQQDAKISSYDQQVKELQAKLNAAQQPVTAPAASHNYETVVQQEIAPLRELITQMAEAQKAQAAELERQKAMNLRRETIDALAKEIPVLQDPRYQSLMPDTSDAAVLKDFGKTLAELAKATEQNAFKQIRDGHVPASMPPRVTPGNEQEFQAEMKRIRGLEKSGQITTVEASSKIQKLASMMKPE